MANDKKSLREQFREIRRAIPVDVAAAAARSLAHHVAENIDLPPGAIVAGYWPFPDEMDPRPLMKHLVALGHSLCLPVVVERAAALQFRAWSPGGSLVDSVYGTQVPPADAPLKVPNVLLVPLLAFDDAGYRLGYGGGYYDRTIADLAPHSPSIHRAWFRPTKGRARSTRRI